MPGLPHKDFLFPQISDLPYFRGLLRAVEARFYQEIDLPAPVLDVGCGDGHFAWRAFEQPIDVGIDPWRMPIREAAQRHIYRLTVQADAGQMPFPAASFASAMSNSVLEHIPHVEMVLAEVGRVLKPGAPFVFCVPNHQFLSTLSVGRAFDRVGLRPVGNAYRSFFNRISRHCHCNDPKTWEARLAKAGFRLERWWHYFPPKAQHVLEWGHYVGLPALITKKLLGRWILSPTRWNLAITERITRPVYEAEPVSDGGVYSFYIARRMEGAS